MIIHILIAIIAIDSFGLYAKCSPPDSSKQIRGIVEDYGYSFQEHYVTTEDGYIITVHRVLNNRIKSHSQKPVALCSHGIMGSSVDWVLNGPKVSLAFILADSGYDVWLFNARGVSNSKKHVKYLPTSYQYWDFSGHEIGYYDLPATIDYALNATGQPDLFYVGFSQGGGILFIMGSLKPEYNKKIRLAALLAPAVYLGGMKSPVRHVFKFAYPITAFLETLGHFELFPDWSLWRVITNFLCSEGSITQFLCFEALFSLVGDGSDQADPKSLTTYLTYFPTGVSTKQFFFYGFFNLHPGHFRQYDYGMAKNLIVYNSPQPPEYPIHKTDIPIAIFQGLNDIVITPSDIDLLVERIPNVIYREMIIKKKLNHMDLIYGHDMRELGYLKILDLFETHRRNETFRRG